MRKEAAISPAVQGQKSLKINRDLLLVSKHEIVYTLWRTKWARGFAYVSNIIAGL